MTEDGVPQEITSFEAVHRPEPGSGLTAPRRRAAPSTNVAAPGQEPASFVIVFDELHLDPGRGRAGSRGASPHFLDAGVADGDRVALVGTAEGTRWTARMPEGTRGPRCRSLARLQGKRVGETRARTT